MDVNFNGVTAGLFIQTKHLSGQLLLAHHPPRPSNHRLQHRLFAGGQGQQSIGKGKAPGIQVIQQVAAALLALATEHCAAQQCLDPCFQFSHFKGFGQVIIGTEIKTMHAILNLTTGGEHQHRQGIAALTQTRQHLKTVQARQADIENRQGVILTAQGQISRHAVMQHVHIKPDATQGLSHAFSQGQMVLDQ